MIGGACGRKLSFLWFIPFIALGISALQIQGADSQFFTGDIVANADLAGKGAFPSAQSPLQMVGVRNGSFSAKFVVKTSGPIQGLEAKVTDFKSAGGATVPVKNIRLRYAVPWPANLPAGRNRPVGLDILLEKPPPEVPGGLAAVWITVDVPATTVPGIFTGRLTVLLQGAKAAEVPVQLSVLDWALPSPRNYRTWVELVQSPDTLLMEYGVPRWSERHWQLIAQSMTYLREVGSRVLYIPLIAETNQGNEQSMVRWIRKGPSQYDFDFSVMDRYLDLAEKQQMGKPEVLVFNAWDRYLGATGKSPHLYMKASPPLVTLLDPATGQAANAEVPGYTDPGNKPVWKSLFDQLHERIRKRGLEKAMQLGMVTDVWAPREQVEFLKEASGSLPWANCGHYSWKSFYDGLLQFGYQASFFGPSFTAKNQQGWKIPELQAFFIRAYPDSCPMVAWRLIAERCVTGTVRGIGRLGADSWEVVKDKAGLRQARVCERFRGGDWGILNINSSTLAPGPEGAVATARFENLREGVQECEALIVLEQALTDPRQKARLGGELAQRCENLLKERSATVWKTLNDPRDAPSWRSPFGYEWYLGSGWQARSEQLYSLAGEVERKVGSISALSSR